MTTKTNKTPPGVNSDHMTVQTVWNSVTVGFPWFVLDIYNYTIVSLKLQHIFWSKTGDISQNVLPFGSPVSSAAATVWHSVSLKWGVPVGPSAIAATTSELPSVTRAWGAEGSCSSRIWLKESLHVFSQSTSERLHYKSLLYVFTRLRTSTVPLSKVRLAG